MPGTIMPWVKAQWFTNSGDPAAGYQLFTYAAGTSNKLSTFSDVDLVTPNANPTILDAAGRAVLFLSAASYKFVLATPVDTDPPLSPIWTVDNVSAVPGTATAEDVQGFAGENLTAGQLVYLSAGDGGATAGRWYLADADNFYSAGGARAVGFVVTDLATGAIGFFRIGGRATGFSSLTPGAVYYASATPGSITSTIPAIGTSLRVVGVADSITTLILAEKAKAQTRERMAAWFTTVGNTGTGEDVLREYTALAGELPLDGMRYDVLAWGKTANNANAKIIRIRVLEGVNDVVTLAFTATASEAGEWRVQATILRNSSVAHRSTAVGMVGPTNGVGSKFSTATITGTTTWANGVSIRLTAEATSDNDVTCEGMVVSRLE